MAQAEPLSAVARASEILNRNPEPEVASIAERAWGVALKATSDLPAARTHLERAVDIAVAADLPRETADARASLSPVLYYLGDTAGALRQLELAAPVLSGRDGARLHMHRAFILQRVGRLPEALEIYRQVLVTMRRTGDVEGEARALTNRGILHAYRGAFAAAEADLQQSERCHLSLGQALDAAEVRHNLGFVAARRGDIPTALRLYDLAEEERRRHGVSRPVTLLDRCEALMTVGLVEEASQVGRLAVQQLAEGGLETDLAEAQLLLSQAAVLREDFEEADRNARQARTSFVRQERPGWAAVARFAGFRIACLDRRLGAAELQAEAEGVVQELCSAGWVSLALDARLLATRAALEAGNVELAGVWMAQPVAARRSAPADLRARIWEALARLRHAQGNGRGARSALLAGVREVVRSRATLGATELRVYAGARSDDLARFGLELALRSGRPDQVLAWTERARAATALRMRPARPPSDPDLADCLAELRHVVSRLEEMGGAGGDTSRLLRQQAVLEAEIRRRARHAAGSHESAAERPPDLGALKRVLGDALLLELVEDRGTLYSVIVDGGRTRLHVAGSAAEIHAATTALRFAIGRLASSAASDASREAGSQLAMESAKTLDESLLGPVSRRVGERPVIIVPTGVLHGVPWSALPTLRGRPFTVSPSAGLWLAMAQKASAAPTTRKTVLVAGPGPTQADGEIGEVRRLYPEATTLCGPQATATAFCDAVAGADLVHVAAHGSFRSDNPLFSSLRLSDGPVTVYDLEGLKAPRTVVLSACEGGLSAVRGGEELMGLAAALLGLGTETLVAGVTTVNDAATRSLMVDFHRRLVAGWSPAEALAQAQTAIPDGPSRLSLSGLVCFGVGLALPSSGPDAVEGGRGAGAAAASTAARPRQPPSARPGLGSRRTLH